jgi:hypothetical protein
MRILGAPLRGVLVPMGAAAATILALAWYGMFWIPTQQQYLNESNLRLLRTMSAQIKARVDNFDQAIDHAIDSFPHSTDDRTAFNEYVQVFAPELEIVRTLKGRKSPSNTTAAQIGAEDLVLERAGDPPRILVRRDEGKSVLYLGYYRPEDDRTVVAKGDIEKVAAPFLATRSQFDAVLLVNADGRVITQKSPSGLELARVDSLVADFAKKRTASHIADVQLGDSPFKLYLQPIQLSLNRAEAPVKRDEPEEWALCGLVRADHFRADSSAISYTYLLWFSAAFALVFVAIPFLKLELLAPRQRLRDVDGVWVAVTTFLGAALLTFCVTDAYFFAVTFQGTTDQQLKGLANALKHHFDNELAAIDRQRNSFDGDAGIWKALGYDTGKDLPDFQASSPGHEAPPPTVSENSCDPPDACREELLGSLPQELIGYPFFERVVWYDGDAKERVKWTTRKRVTPFIDLKDAQLADSSELLRASGIDVIQSPTTGDTVTGLWNVHEPSSTNGQPGSRFRGQWLSLGTPLSFRQPVVPPGVRFALVNADGLVLYHSDPTRNLKQNFFEETENNPALRAAALGRYDDLITGNYEGRRHRFQVTPIDVDAGIATRPRQWSLIVFQETRVPETVNLEVLTLAVFVFLVYSAILAGFWAAAYFLWAGYPQNWFWPNHSKYLAYWKVVVVNLLLLAVSLRSALYFESTRLVVETVACALIGLVTTFWILTRDPSGEGAREGVDRRWRESFYLARLSLVLILAVVPAFACFRAAYEFETRLLIKSGQASLARQLDARKRLIADEAEGLEFCDSGGGCLRSKESFTKNAFTDRRSQLALDIYVGPFFGTCLVHGGNTFFSDIPVPERQGCDRVVDAQWRLQDGSLDHMFGAIHRSYNDVAMELEAAESKPNSPSAVDLLLNSDPLPATALPGPGYWFALAVVLAALYALMRYFADRLFVLDLYEPPAADVVPESSADDEYVLLLGPPGCGKTRRLLKDERLEYIDIREKVLEERRERARPVVGEPDVVATVAALVPRIPEAQRPQSTPPPHVESWADRLIAEGKGSVALDHFEYGFDDPVFRDQMLSVIEELIYRQRRAVWIASTQDPWRRVQVEPDGTGSSLSERDRWVRVFKSFHTVNMPFKENKACETPYYHVLWAGCSREEQLALRQLAEENVVNPNNESVLQTLLRDGLIVRKPTFHIVNEKFRRFILHAQSSSTIAEWEREGVVLSWATIRTTLVTVAVGIVGLLLLTQQQLVEAWVGYIPMLAPAIPTAMKVLGSFQRDGKLSVPST